MAAAVNLVVGGVLYSGSPEESLAPYWLAVTVAGFFALMIGFLLNALMNFRAHDQKLSRQFKTYALIALSCIGITTVLAEASLVLMTNILAQNAYDVVGVVISLEFACHVFSIACVAVYSYMMHKHFTFRACGHGHDDSMWNNPSKSRH